MQRRAAIRKSLKPTAPRNPPANHCRAVVRVDGSDIRKKIKKDYEKALRDLAKSRQLLDQFQQTDNPQFTRWFNSQFGALLTELRELSQKLAAEEDLVYLVENEVMFGGGSYARAYQRVMEMRENPEPPPIRPDDGTDGERDPFGAGPESDSPDGEEDPMEEFFRNIFGEFGPEEESADPRHRQFGRGTESRAPVHQSARLKELYRAVVRRLHPDSQREMTAQKTEWWHQAQAAYEAGDVEQLEVILTLCEIGESGTTAHTSATLLQRITAQLKSSLREIKRQLTVRRREPAWNFSKRTDRLVMTEQMRHQLTGELQAMRAHWRRMQEMIAGWKAGAERLQQPRRRKRQPQNPEFLF